MSAYVFIASIVLAVLARVLVDRKMEQQGRPRIGWVVGFAVFFAINGLYSLFTSSGV